MPPSPPNRAHRRKGNNVKNHFLDKPILRDLFWFIVLPYKAKQWAKENGNG